MKNYNSIFSLNLRKLLALENMSQAELANRADISKTTVNLILNEKYNPSLELMSVIAEVLSVSLSTLLSDNDDSTSCIKKELDNGKVLITATVNKLQAFQIEKWHNVTARNHKQ